MIIIMEVIFILKKIKNKLGMFFIIFLNIYKIIELLFNLKYLIKIYFINNYLFLF